MSLFILGNLLIGTENECGPVGKDGRVSRVGGNSNGLAHNTVTATDVQPDIVLALAGWISRMPKGE